MLTIRLTKIFEFEMAHALAGYDGPCKNIHGHSYKLHVTLKGDPISDSTNPKDGMVFDFGDLKKIIKSEIIDKFDHALVLNDRINKSDLLDTSEMFSNLIVVPFQPTCENFLIDFAYRIQKHLPKEISLHSLKLWETSSSYAEWFADDNK